MKYYISNDIHFIRGYGNLVETPSSATHMRSSDAANYISIHPDHEVMKLSRSSKKKKDYVVSTRKQFIGVNNTIVNNLSDARSFNSIESAFSYIDNIVNTNNLLNKAFVIDENYKRMLRPEEYRLRQQNLANRPGRRINFDNELRNSVQKKSQCCAICGKPISDDEFSIDHIIPISRGGNNSIDNLRPVHRRCNTIKDNMLDDELLQHTTDILCYNLYNNPNSDSFNKLIRAIVRGTINNTNT